jgi:hypothetical protein
MYYLITVSDRITHHSTYNKCVKSYTSVDCLRFVFTDHNPLNIKR